MSLKRHCDACGQAMEPTPKRQEFTVTSASNGKHLARVTVDVLTLTGKEDVCWGCVFIAIRDAYPKDSGETNEP